MRRDWGGLTLPLGALELVLHSPPGRSEGQYAIQVEGKETDEHGRWFTLSVTEMETGEETWIGSLRFPARSGQAKIYPYCSTAIEVYGRPVAPSQIPYWQISVSPPLGDGTAAVLRETYYPDDVENLRNALITTDKNNVQLEVGLDYMAHE